MACCVFTRGEFFIREAAGLCASGDSLSCGSSKFTKIGNVIIGQINIDGEVYGTENEFNPALPESRQEIRAVNLSLQLACADSENLRLAFLSKKPPQDSGSQVDSFATCGELKSGDFLPFSKKIASNVTVFLRGDDTLVLEEGVDYTLSKSGASIIRDIDCSGYEEVRLSYDFTSSSERIEFFSEVKNYKEVYFKGINFGEGEAMFDAQFYRVLFGPVNETDLITKDEMLTLSLTGSVESVSGEWFNITKE